MTRQRISFDVDNGGFTYGWESMLKDRFNPSRISNVTVENIPEQRFEVIITWKPSVLQRRNAADIQRYVADSIGGAYLERPVEVREL